MARRVSYLNTFKKLLPEVPTLAVDTGYFLADDVLAHGFLRGDARVKNRWVIDSFDRYPVDVVNVSLHDSLFLKDLLKADGFEERVRLNPILGRLVSANLVPESNSIVRPAPFAVRQIPLRGAGKGRISVAILGLSGLTRETPPGFRLAEPIEAAKRAAAEARSRADLVIAIGHLPTDLALRIAAEVPDLTAVIASNGEIFTPGVQIGQTRVAFTPLETRYLGELRIYREPNGKFRVVDRYIPLDKYIPDDPGAAEFVAASGKESRGARGLTGHVKHESPPPSPDAPVLVGAQSCAACHLAEYSKWTASSHYTSLNSVLKMQDFADSSCLECHTTGFKMGGRAPADHLQKFSNVQCEQCHGPASAHISDPTLGYGRIAEVEASCRTCHSEHTTPKFDLGTYWERIRH